MTEIDPRRRDRLREEIERNVPDQPGRPRVAAEIAPAEREVDIRQRARGLADQLGHPLAAELVAVAVEEHVRLLLHRPGREELRVGAPEDGLGSARAELEQALEPALRVRDDKVVLARIGTVVVVEAGVHAAELGQAHRRVAVVEDDRDSEALAQSGRDAAEVRHRHGEDDHRVGPLLLDEALEVAPPARRHEPPDRLARDPVAERSSGQSSARRRYRSPLSRASGVPRAGVRLALQVGRVGRRSPPGRLDRPAAVRRDDEIGALVVEALPELPPGGRAAVAKVEVDSGGDAEELRRAHRPLVSQAAVTTR